MKKYIILWVLVLCCFSCFSVEASIGKLDILVNEKEEFAFTYTKVADYKDGEYILKEPYKDCDINLNELFHGSSIREAAEILAAYEGDKTGVETKNYIAQIGPLTEGVYLIEGFQKEGYEVPATLVSIPQWDVETEELTYDVTIVPKIQKTVESVDTGDSENIVSLLGLCFLSLVVVIGISGRAYFLKDK